MVARPFLIFPSKDENGRPVLKVQGDGIPLTERPLDLKYCMDLAKMFTDVAVEIMAEERRERKAQS